ncbi:aminotransferase family protein [Brucella anthropi]|uniref:Aminotransferase class III-fold pyridoxal phosphate-dependent enzyme n=1 Tax=Brucella anthropi TaxID=529 RepID=A0A6L3Z113_BRUAN|nr:aminotransferase [Brucella anthropi]KAB2764280.1 aminotransferase class III-fold pyridoxal phosphate-dependent enzyme [Brucella anthropi]
MDNARLNHSLANLDRDSLLHPVSSVADVMANGPSIYKSARGATVTNADGEELIDLGAGLWCVNVGYGRKELADAASQSMLDLSYQHFFGGASAEPTIRLADRLLTLFREQSGARHMARVFFGTSGSDANDTAFKLVRYYHNIIGKPQKKKIISRIGAYHGVTYASGSLTGIASYHKAFDQPIDGVLHTSCPHYYGFGQVDETEESFTDRMITDLERLIEAEGPETIAAFIAEPVMGTGGVFAPPVGYFEKVQKLLDRYEILLILDEVITGFGRLGQWFGTGAFNLKPDIVSLAKGLTSAYFPMSASVISNRIWSALEDASLREGTFMHGFTYSGHPVGSAVAMANLDVIERDGLVELAAKNGPYLLEGLMARLGDNPFIGDIRGIGMMAAVEYVADRSSKRPFPVGTAPHRVIAKRATELGVLTRGLPFLPVNSFSPPLSITRDEIDKGLDRFAKAVEQSMTELSAMMDQNSPI